MNRIFTIIIAGALVFIGVSSVMDKNGQDSTEPTMAVISNPLTQMVSEQKDGEEAVVADDQVGISDDATAAEQAASDIPGARPMNRDELVERSIREDLELDESVRKHTAEPGSITAGHGRTTDRVYSDEEEWNITAQTQNDLSALSNIINN